MNVKISRMRRLLGGDEVALACMATLARLRCRHEVHRKQPRHHTQPLREHVVPRLRAARPCLFQTEPTTLSVVESIYTLHCLMASEMVWLEGVRFGELAPSSTLFSSRTHRNLFSRKLRNFPRSTVPQKDRGCFFAARRLLLSELQSGASSPKYGGTTVHTPIELPCSPLHYPRYPGFGTSRTSRDDPVTRCRNGVPRPCRNSERRR